MIKVVIDGTTMCDWLFGLVMSRPVWLTMSGLVVPWSIWLTLCRIVVPENMIDGDMINITVYSSCTTRYDNFYNDAMIYLSTQQLLWHVNVHIQWCYHMWMFTQVIINPLVSQSCLQVGISLVLIVYKNRNNDLARNPTLVIEIVG